jgi:hypothetical protein
VALLLGWPLVLAPISLAIGASLVAWILAHGTVAQRLLRGLQRLAPARAGDWLASKEAAFRALDGGGRAFFTAGPGPVLRACALFLPEWLAEATETYVIAQVLGIPLDFGSAVAFEGLTSFWRSSAFFLPAGIGLQDALHVALVQATGAADPLTAGAAFLFLRRAREALWILIGAALAARGDAIRAPVASASAPGCAPPARPL